MNALHRMSYVPIVRAENLALHFDQNKTRALDGINVDVGEGEFLAIVGPSGCGKSSLLNLIGLLDAPTAGEIYFRGQPYSAIRDPSLFRRKHIGFVFQSFHLIPTLSVLENVLVPTIAGPASISASRQDCMRSARSLLSRLGLDGKLDQFPGTMSGGERQRVAIARALINNPDLILADEPTGSLDSSNAAQVLDLLCEFKREKGLTVIMVTHDADVSARADRAIHVRDGRLDLREEYREFI
ncbi:MAG: ABC transporter ATP-binding protein [Burkholderiaceae bacterium]|nr:ABC transporter ATP-binding protein [Burkholderiaceae bacterium]